MSRIIINADDFGLTAGVNRAITELHSQGLLTSATLMSRAAATNEAIEIALRTPTLGVGCHVVLVDGEPALPPTQLPTLVDAKTGRFQPTLGAFLARLLTGQIRREEIKAEAEAQMNRLRKRGLALTHLDTHKHTHMFPAVLNPLLQAANACGVPAIRNPFEPAWSLRATPNAPLIRRAEVALLRQLAPGFYRRVKAAGIATTNGAIGVLATGTLDAATVTSLLNAVPAESVWELVTHPGYNDTDLAQARTRLLASREVERAALSALNNFPAIERVSFAALNSNSRIVSAN